MGGEAKAAKDRKARAEDVENASAVISATDRIMVAGLGNPGGKYDATRHNIGFMVVDALADRQGIRLLSKRHDGLYGDGSLGRRRLALIKPQTFMNLSGRSVAPACRYFSVEMGGLIVVHDDVDLPFGRIKLKWAGGHGGHNGLRSLDQSLGGPNYFRVRMGVGRPRGRNMTGHVLSRFSGAEQTLLRDVVAGGLEAIDLLTEVGLKEAQNRIHPTVFAQVEDPGEAAKK